MPAKKRTQKSSTTYFRWWGNHILAFFCCMTAAVLVAFGVKAYLDHAPLMKVGENRISREEYSWAMYAARDDILSVHSARGISLDHWDAETELGLPYEMVTERAVQILREYYAITDLAEERGYLEDGSFAALQKQLEEENRQRNEAISSGGIVTGLTSFDLEQYIAYRTGSLRRLFCDDDTNSEMQVTEAEVRQRYETEKSSLYTMEDSVVLHYIQIDTSLESGSLEEDVRLLRQRAVDCGSLEEAMKDMPHLQEYYRELTVDGANYAVYARGYADLLSFSAELQTGDISEVICRDGLLCLIECAQRIDHDFQPLENVYAVVERSIQEERYDALVSERTEQMNAEYDADALYRYTAQMLK